MFNNEIIEIKATSLNEYEIKTESGHKYILSPMRLNEDIIVFNMYTTRESPVFLGELDFNTKAGINAKLEEALKEINKSVNDLKEYLTERQRKLSMIRQLRDETKAGMILCKRALERTDWVMDKAKQYLKDHPIRMGI